MPLVDLVGAVDVPGPFPLEAWILVAAFAWDQAIGEPPARAHPVVWMGRVIGALERRAARGNPALELAQGLVLALGLPLLFAAAAAWLCRLFAPSATLSFLVGTWLLKSTFAARALGEAAAGVAAALRAGDLPRARLALRSLCSRDPAALDEGGVAAGAVESVAENASDSVVAPLLFFALFGLPGAVFYRVANTMDAMIGYRGPYEHLGKAAARLDDLLNLVPARLTALLLLGAGALLGYDPAAGARILARDGGKTESPNAGRPMAAMAGLLGVRLEKAGHYALGDEGIVPSAATIDASWRIVRRAAALAVAGAIGLVLLGGGGRG